MDGEAENLGQRSLSGDQLWFQRAGQWQVALWVLGHDEIGSEVNAQDIRERREHLPGITAPDDLRERQEAITAQIVELFQFNQKYRTNFHSLGEALQYTQDQVQVGDEEISRLRKVEALSQRRQTLWFWRYREQAPARRLRTP